MVPAAGLTKQPIVPDCHPAATWHKSAAIVFNVQLLDAAGFEAVTGIAVPESPITTETYAELGLPVLNLHRDQSGIHGSFKKVKSGSEISGLAGQSVNVSVHTINQPTTANPQEHARDEDLYGRRTDITNPAGPYLEFRHVTELVKELQDAALADLYGDESEWPLMSS